MQDWNGVSDYLVTKCNEHGGYYKLTIKEANRLAKRTERLQMDTKIDGRKISETIIPVYMMRHPDYEFGVSKDEKYVWCRRRGVLG